MCAAKTKTTNYAGCIEILLFSSNCNKTVERRQYFNGLVTNFVFVALVRNCINLQEAPPDVAKLALSSSTGHSKMFTWPSLLKTSIAPLLYIGPIAAFRN